MTQVNHENTPLRMAALANVVAQYVDDMRRAQSLISPLTHAASAGFGNPDEMIEGLLGILERDTHDFLERVEALLERRQCMCSHCMPGNSTGEDPDAPTDVESMVDQVLQDMDNKQGPMQHG